MKNFKEEIQKAKEETIAVNIAAWKDNWCREYLKNNPNSGGVLIKDIPEPPADAVTPKSWFITEWCTGFIVADLDKLMKLPKRSRDKIFALGGI